MIYRVIGVMSGSSLDGLDLACVEFEVVSRNWQFNVLAAQCYPYPEEWVERLSRATTLSARDHALLDADLGHYIGREVNRFIEENHLQYKVALVSSHGHTSFHIPPHVTVQLGQGAAIAAETGLPVVSDLRAMDVALGGQGAPIVPMGERLLWNDVPMFLNIGGIANISVNTGTGYIAYDVCPANRVLNLLAGEAGLSFDDGGKMAGSGTVLASCLEALNNLPYYGEAYPKSLANDFGTDLVYPLIRKAGGSLADQLRTYTEHIAIQVAGAVEAHAHQWNTTQPRLMITGGGAFNLFLVNRIRELLAPMRVEVEIPDQNIVQYKEAIVMGLLGILRWRDEPTTLASVTGARRDGVGGAVWQP